MLLLSVEAARSGKPSSMVMRGQNMTRSACRSTNGSGSRPMVNAWRMPADSASKWQVVIDGRPEAACDEIQQDGVPFYFSPDGKRTAYMARIGAKWFVVIDGQPGPSCYLVERGSFEFSDDGVRTAYVALATTASGRWSSIIGPARSMTRLMRLRGSSPYMVRVRRTRPNAMTSGAW